MILYNVTVALEPAIETEWLAWMQQEHIPEVMATGCFTGYKIYKVLLEKDSLTYAIQYFAPNMAALQRYQGRYAPALQAKHRQKFGEQATAFRTLLEEIT